MGLAALAEASVGARESVKAEDATAPRGLTRDIQCGTSEYGSISAGLRQKQAIYSYPSPDKSTTGRSHYCLINLLSDKPLYETWNTYI